MSAINFVNYRGRWRVRTSAPLPKASYQIETVDNGAGFAFGHAPGDVTILYRLVCMSGDTVFNLFMNSLGNGGGNVVVAKRGRASLNTQGGGRVVGVQFLNDEELRQTRKAIDEWMHQEVKA